MAKKHYGIKSEGDNCIFVPPNLISGGTGPPCPPGFTPLVTIKFIYRYAFCVTRFLKNTTPPAACPMIRLEFHASIPLTFPMPAGTKMKGFNSLNSVQYLDNGLKLVEVCIFASAIFKIIIEPGLIHQRSLPIMPSQFPGMPKQ